MSHGGERIWYVEDESGKKLTKADGSELVFANEKAVDKWIQEYSNKQEIAQPGTQKWYWKMVIQVKYSKVRMVRT